MLKLEYKELIVILSLLCGCSSGAGDKPAAPVSAADSTAGSQAPSWPAEVQEVAITSSLDGTAQPAMFWTPEGAGPHPLLVALHTWSGDYRQAESINYWEGCRERGWVFIHPNFRGPNVQPEACGSEAVVQDVLDAVEYAKANTQVDSRRIYLVGCSGGGYLTLLMAGRSRSTWTAASAWVPISELAAWQAQCSAPGNPNQGYAGNLVAVCGGAPGSSAAVDSQYARRSALTWLAQAAALPLDINAGIHDGHSGSVPVSHSLRAFNLLARVNGAPEKYLTDSQIDSVVANQSLPPELTGQAEPDSLYAEKTVLFRRSAGPARVTLFEGGHEIVYRAALAWLARWSK
ncbi:prolyl oligopeptidase family serine peptidase [bacterium]|nr:prolyl oligopeptidase family serine peptidase [bacterium]